MLRLSPGSGTTNGGSNSDMARVRDNGAINNYYITTITDKNSAKIETIETYFLIFVWEKNEIDSSCDKWTGYKRPWFHSYFFIPRIVSHHYGSSSQTTTYAGVTSVRWTTEYSSTPASASASTCHPSAQVEAAATMVVTSRADSNPCQGKEGKKAHYHLVSWACIFQGFYPVKAPLLWNLGFNYLIKKYW